VKARRSTILDRHRERQAAWRIVRKALWGYPDPVCCCFGRSGRRPDEDEQSLSAYRREQAERPVREPMFYRRNRQRY